MNEVKMTDQKQQELTVPVFGYELIREILLPNILGKDAASILYWGGKELARKYPLENIDEIVAFFAKAGWGDLFVKEEGKNKIEFELSGPIVSKRLENNHDVTFQLEAGFIAQQIEIQKQCVAESYENPKKRAKKIFITTKWDKKDPVE